MPLSKSANAGTAIAIAITQAIARVRKRLLSFFMMYSSILKETCIGFVSGRICSASARRCLSLRCGWRFFGTTSLYQKVFTFATFRQYFKSSMYSDNYKRLCTDAYIHIKLFNLGSGVPIYLDFKIPQENLHFHKIDTKFESLVIKYE